MSNYKKVLVAIDFFAEYDKVLQQAVSLGVSLKHINLVYVSLPWIYMQPYAYEMADVLFDDQELMDKAKDRLHVIADKFNIPKKNVYVKSGKAANEIKALASEIKADLIVIGTHGESGFMLLLGSTANAVLHGVQQDVLAVRLNQD